MSLLSIAPFTSQIRSSLRNSIFALILRKLMLDYSISMKTKQNRVILIWQSRLDMKYINMSLCYFSLCNKRPVSICSCEDSGIALCQEHHESHALHKFIKLDQIRNFDSKIQISSTISSRAQEIIGILIKINREIYKSSKDLEEIISFENLPKRQSALNGKFN